MNSNRGFATEATPQKKKKSSWIKTALGSAALAIVAWEAVRFYRKIRVPEEAERNPALPPSPFDTHHAPPGPAPAFMPMPMPMPYPFPQFGAAPSPAPSPAPAPEPSRNSSHTYTAKELAAMLKQQRAIEKEVRMQAAMMDLE